MRVVRIAVVFALIAGCLEGTQDPAGGVVATGSRSASASTVPAAPSAAAEPAPSAETGALLVTVTTPEIQPVPSAQVALEGVGSEYAALTDDAGQATFNGLEPGKYTILVAKPGFKSTQEKGKLVDIIANEVTEAKLTLAPEAVVEASNRYHRSVNFVGLMGCSFQGAPGTIGYTTYCSRGASIAGQSLRDPNDNSSHYWDIDNIQIQTLLVEGRWQPSNGLNSRALTIGTYTSFSCTDPGSLGAARTCTPSNSIKEYSGPSPAYVIAHEAPNLNLTKRIGNDPAKYPAKVRTEVRAACDGCVGFAIVIQQRYDAWGTAFYGAEAPMGWSVYPSN